MPAVDRSYGTIEIVTIHRLRSRRRESQCSCLKLCRYLCLAFLIFVVAEVLLVFCSSFPTWAGSHRGIKKKPDISEQRFAVGFDLSAGYGTAAASFPNGTTSGLGWYVLGSPEYNKFMAKASLESSQHPTPPYYGHGYYSDLPRQMRRKLRKRIGLPASQEVAALAYVLQLLKNTSEQEIGPIRYVFVTVPHFPALYNEDLLDACNHVGLQILTLPWYVFQAGDTAQFPVTHVNTAMAGNGIGVCKDFKNATHCRQQLHCPENDNMLSVLYTRYALTAHVSPICDAMHFYAADGIANTSLGYGQVELPQNLYWEEVRGALRDAMKSYRNRGDNLGLVIAHGESVKDNPSFVKLLQEEVKKAQVSGRLPEFSAKNPMFAAARGASEFAKRCMFTDLDCTMDLFPRGPGW